MISSNYKPIFTSFAASNSIYSYRYHNGTKNYIDTSISVIDMNDAMKDQNLLSILRQLTSSSKSGMNMALNHFEKLIDCRPIQARAILARYADNSIVGWNLLSYESDGFFFNPTPQTMVSHTYVAEDFRKYGIGKKLFTKAIHLINDNETIRIYDSTIKSSRFFAPFMKQCPNVKSIWDNNFKRRDLGV
jgi:hypothetical protein